MAKNNEFVLTGDNDLLSGFSNMLAKENRSWWRTRKWLVQTLVWLVLINGIVAIVLFVAPKADAEQHDSASQQGQQNLGAEAPIDSEGLDIMGLAISLSMLGLISAIGVAILGQDTMINEKTHGTAAWVLSKPVSRSAFVLAKIVSNAIGTLITMVIIQGAVTYLLIYLATGTTYPLIPFAGALGLAFLSLFFFLTLTIMLGTMSNSRGLVLGIPLLLALGYQLLIILGNWITEIMPWNLTTSLGEAKPALSLVLVQGQPLPTVNPLIATFLWSILFIGIALWRFKREEF